MEAMTGVAATAYGRAGRVRDARVLAGLSGVGPGGLELGDVGTDTEGTAPRAAHDDTPQVVIAVTGRLGSGMCDSVGSYPVASGDPRAPPGSWALMSYGALWSRASRTCRFSQGTTIASSSARVGNSYTS